MPTFIHQRILLFLIDAFRELVHQRHGGEFLIAPLPVRLFPGTYREPDLLYLSPTRNTLGKKYPDGIDLALEIVSDDLESHKRDYVEKRADYARAKVAEYWIVDPQAGTITVLSLAGDDYREHGAFKAGSVATSVLLDGLSVSVDAVFAAGAGPDGPSTSAQPFIR